MQTVPQALETLCKLLEKATADIADLRRSVDGIATLLASLNAKPYTDNRTGCAPPQTTINECNCSCIADCTGRQPWANFLAQLP